MAVAELSADQELHWIALHLVPGIGARRACQLIERFRTPEAVFRASRAELEDAGLSGGLAQTVASGCTFDNAIDQQKKLRDSQTALVPITDKRYPERLKEIFDPPVVLYACGRLELLASLMIGIVGTRRPSAYGVAATERLATDLANANLTIVSGMARGIDTAAHRAVFSANGNTIAVFGCGVDVVYPAENRKLAGEIGDYPLDTDSPLAA